MVTASAALDSPWFVWNLDPTVVVPLVALLAAHLYALGPLRRKLGEVALSPAQIAYLTAGYVTLWFALISPLDALGDEYLFSAHMVQHMLISIVVPPLLLLGTPQWLQAWVVEQIRAGRVLRWIGQPVVAFGIFNADLWLWHVPALYDATLSNDAIHAFEHLTFFAFGLLFWLPVLGPARIVPRISKGFAIFYLFLACQPMVVLGALLTFAAQPLYAPYVAAPRVWGLSPLQDQQLGGLIMWLPTNIPYLLGITLLFFQWLAEQERTERKRFNDDAPYELFPTSAPRATAAASEGISLDAEAQGGELPV